MICSVSSSVSSLPVDTSAASLHSHTKYSIEYPDKPLKTLWNVLNDGAFKDSKSAALSIVLDNSCGLERRSSKTEGTFYNRLGGWGIAYGATPLIMAAQAGRCDVASALIEAGAAVNAKVLDPKPNLTTLHVSAANGDLATVALLLAHGALVDAVDGTGRTPLHTAIFYGHIKIAEELLDAGACLDHIDNFGYTALHLAATKGSVAEVKMLVAAGASLKTVGRWSPLQRFVSFGKKHCSSKSEEQLAKSLLREKNS